MPETRPDKDGDDGEGQRGEAQERVKRVDGWVVLFQKWYTPETRREIHEAIHRLDGGQPNPHGHRQVPGNVGGEGVVVTDEVRAIVLMLRHQVQFGSYMQLSTDTVRKLIYAVDIGDS